MGEIIMKYEINKYYIDEDCDEFINDMICELEIEEKETHEEVEEYCKNIICTKKLLFHKSNLILEKLEYNDKIYYILEDLEAELLYLIKMGG